MCENKLITMSGNEVNEGTDTVRCLNANDQRKVFGAKQERSMVAVSFANGEVQSEIDTAHCLCGNYATKEGLHSHQQVTKVVCPVLTPDREEKRQNGRRIKDNGEPAFTLTAQDRHGVAIEVKEATKQGYAVAHEGDSINLSMPDSKTRRGRVGGGGGADVGHKLQSGSDRDDSGDYP